MKTRKIVSLLLAALMILSAVPMMFMTVATADEPAVAAATTNREIFSGIIYDTVTIYNTTTNGAGGWINEIVTDLSDVTASGKNAVDAAGVLIDVKWTGISAPASTAMVKFKWNGGGGDTRGTFYGASSTYISGTDFASDGWININSADWAGTVFIPKANLNNWGTTDFAKFSIAVPSGGTFENIRLAYVVDPESIGYTSVSLYTPDGGVKIDDHSWHTYTDGVGTAIAASGRRPTDAAGIMFDISWSGASSAAVSQLKLKLDNNPSTLGSDGVVRGAFIGDSAYVTGVDVEDGLNSTSSWLDVKQTDWSGKIYLPREYFNNWNTQATFEVISMAVPAGATFSNVRLVYEPGNKETYNGIAYETISIYDPETPTNTTTGNWATYTTDLSKVTAAGKTPKDAAGILVDVKWTNATATYGFKFQLDTNPRTENSDGATGGYFFGTTNGQFDERNWLLIKQTAWEGTIFIPAGLLNNWDTTSFNNISFQSKNATDATIDNVRLAYTVEETAPVAPGGPATLPDINQTWTKSALFVDSAVQFGIDTSKGKDNPVGIYGTATDAMLHSMPYGLTFTIDASSLGNGNTLDFTFATRLKLSNGAETYLSPTPYGAAIMRSSYTNVPEVNPTDNPISEDWYSNWYVSFDGTTWTTVRQARDWNGSKYAGGRYGVISGASYKTVYVYIPMSEFWISDGAQYLTTGSRPTGKENIMRFTDFCNLMAENGTTWSLYKTQFTWNNSSATKSDGTEASIATSSVRTVRLYNFWLVGCDHEWFDTDASGNPVSPVVCDKCGATKPAGVEIDAIVSSSITLTDDLSYNVYVNLPDGATDDKVTFMMGDKTVTVSGVLQPDGKMKYTFTDILPQYIGDEITIAWSATVDGGEVSDTKTVSVLSYVKALLATSEFSEWHELGKALLHYGAAAQAYKGATEGFVNEGIDAVANPTSLAALSIAYTNGNKDVFKTAALRLDNAIALKIGVVAPAGVTEVSYTVGERNGTAEIVNGYVLIPVYAYEMMEAIEITCGDATLTISASWYLVNADTTENANLASLIQAIADYAVAAALKTGNLTVAPLAVPTLTQIKLVENGGMSYVIQLENRHYIVIDGGTANQGTDTTAINTKRMMTFLTDHSGGKTPVIEAWIFTHQHADHVNNAFNILQNYSNELDVKRFIYNWAPDGLDVESTFVAEKLTLWNNLLSNYPDTELIAMKQNDVYTIGTVKIDVLLTSAQNGSNDSKNFATPTELNYLSAAFRMTFTQGTDATADDKTFLVLGDCTADRLEYLMKNYNIKSDVLQATHHGLGLGNVASGSSYTNVTATKAAYQEVAPSITLVPTYENRFNVWFKGDSAALYDDVDDGESRPDNNKWLYENSDCYHASKFTTVNMKDLTVTTTD